MTNFVNVSKLNTVFGNEQGDPNNPNWEKIQKQLHLIQEETAELSEGVDTKNWQEMRDAVSDILVVTYGMAHIMGIDVDADMAAVQDSNMSKLCTTPEEVETTLGFYEQEVGIQVYAEGHFPEVAIKSSQDQTGTDEKFYPKGKFLKNTNWHEPRLT
ncbi:MAG: nucleoside triphosphate pyrophosphohydrolase family protein [Neptuniibacter sp.]